ncbi:MAG: SPFH domain-containing protein [Hyphomonadaceae bacterium]|jgi:regulator of protease activity HflC (stomatin/prohibitin superfamily)|nr:SPFH domain-containing protein [Hyphomonadaceae bacterium]
MSGPILNRSQERRAFSLPGLLMATLCVLAIGFGVLAMLGVAVLEGSVLTLGGTVMLVGLASFGLAGLYMLQPNEAMAITLFGAYAGTDRAEGLRWVLPWMGRKKISMRVRNITSDTLKVNDLKGNPVEIAANVVWRVQDSAQALFDVDDYESFCKIEIDTALRDIAAHYAYDHAEEGELTLRANAEEVAGLLRSRLDQRLSTGGMTVDEARISHLAYAPEIAGAMLKRQQAEAVLAARAKIVDGAVTMVESALHQLSSRGVVELDDERKAQMVSNLLVVLCADREAQPVVNTGSLY